MTPRFVPGRPALWGGALALALLATGCGPGADPKASPVAQTLTDPRDAPDDVPPPPLEERRAGPVVRTSDAKTLMVRRALSEAVPPPPLENRLAELAKREVMALANGQVAEAEECARKRRAILEEARPSLDKTPYGDISK